MAFFDWNHDGKKDAVDDFIEYNIYEDCTEDTEESNKTSYTPSNGGGISNFGVVLSIIAGLVGQVIIYMALGIEVEDVPVIVMIILWVIITTVAGFIAEKIGL